jgi:hypothetical protein
MSFLVQTTTSVILSCWLGMGSPSSEPSWRVLVMSDGRSGTKVAFPSECGPSEPPFADCGNIPHSFGFRCRTSDRRWHGCRGAVLGALAARNQLPVLRDQDEPQARRSSCSCHGRPRPTKPFRTSGTSPVARSLYWGCDRSGRAEDAFTGPGGSGMVEAGSQTGHLPWSTTSPRPRRPNPSRPPGGGANCSPGTWTCTARSRPPRWGGNPNSGKGSGSWGFRRRNRPEILTDDGEAPIRP